MTVEDSLNRLKVYQKSKGLDGETTRLTPDMETRKEMIDLILTLYENESENTRDQKILALVGQIQFKQPFYSSRKPKTVAEMAGVNLENTQAREYLKEYSFKNLPLASFASKSKAHLGVILIDLTKALAPNLTDALLTGHQATLFESPRPVDFTQLAPVFDLLHSLQGTTETRAVVSVYDPWQAVRNNIQSNFNIEANVSLEEIKSLNVENAVKIFFMVPSFDEADKLVESYQKDTQCDDKPTAFRRLGEQWLNLSNLPSCNGKMKIFLEKCATTFLLYAATEGNRMALQNLAEYYQEIANKPKQYHGRTKENILALAGQYYLMGYAAFNDELLCIKGATFVLDNLNSTALAELQKHSILALERYESTSKGDPDKNTRIIQTLLSRFYAQQGEFQKSIAYAILALQPLDAANRPIQASDALTTGKPKFTEEEINLYVEACYNLARFFLLPPISKDQTCPPSMIGGYPAVNKYKIVRDYVDAELGLKFLKELHLNNNNYLRLLNKNRVEDRHLSFSILPFIELDFERRLEIHLAPENHVSLSEAITQLTNLTMRYQSKFPGEKP